MVLILMSCGPKMQMCVDVIVVIGQSQNTWTDGPVKCTSLTSTASIPMGLYVGIVR